MAGVGSCFQSATESQPTAKPLRALIMCVYILQNPFLGTDNYSFVHGGALR